MIETKNIQNHTKTLVNENELTDHECGRTGK